MLGKTESDVVLGTRDSFHVPCVLVCSDYLMSPGEPVQFDNVYFTKVKPLRKGVPHAFVDPLVDSRVLNTPGSKFWVIVRPKNATDIATSPRSEPHVS